SMHDSIFTQDYAGATNVLIRSSSALGDSLMLTAVTEELRTQFPHLHISVSGNDLVREVFRFNTSVDSVLTANSPAEFAVEERADIVIEYNHIIDRIQEYYNGAHFMDILGAIAGIRLHSKSLHYTLSATDTHNAATLIHEQYPVRPPMLIGIHCHTEKDLKRSYPYTVALVTALQALYPNAGIIHFGNYTYSDMPKGVLDCADRRTSLRTQIATAKECTAFISIDSAFFHIAHNLFGKPTLLLQSVTNEQLIGNLENTIVRVMRSGRTNCTPCYWSCKQHCLSQIHPVEIAAEFNTFLAELHDTGTTPETPLHSQVLV
ncbi:MAG: hypothetical protein JNL32_11595, partial [Candidatus Kapabacteria bacterium]|nr:hypothetical protein [Candidatus Kapabacteria bacterium]